MENGRVIDDLTLLGAAEWLLRHQWDLFSKKQSPDTGDWWVILYRVSRPDTDTRVKGEGATLTEAMEDAMAKAGIGGLRWKLHKLNLRLIQLQDLIEPRKRKACRHGTTTKCNECSG